VFQVSLTNPIFLSALIFVVVAFLVTFVQMSLIHHRVFAKHGFWAFVKGRVRTTDVYWRDLSIAQRLRFWVGMVSLWLFVAVLLAIQYFT
jgi:hypothetical protein